MFNLKYSNLVSTQTDRNSVLRARKLRAKARPFTPWAYGETEKLLTNYRYEILQNLDNSFAFRIIDYQEYWLHPSTCLENTWLLYIRGSGWLETSTARHWGEGYFTLEWSPEDRMFTKGITLLPLCAVMVMEMFNLLVNKIEDGFDPGENARIIYGDGPFEESHE